MQMYGVWNPVCLKNEQATRVVPPRVTADLDDGAVHHPPLPEGVQVCVQAFRHEEMRVRPKSEREKHREVPLRGACEGPPGHCDPKRRAPA